ncbi:MAG: FHA domain-containing protein [Gemmata sp.]
MSDPRLQSIHLAGQPRRDTFRAARDRLEAACGSQTLAGFAQLLDDSDPNGPTLVTPEGARPSTLAARFTFFLKDGVNVYPLHVGMNSVGRLPDNDVVVRDECVSRRHCAVLIHSDLRCELHDVASKNGTLLNGKKIPRPTKIQSGDQITLSDRRLTFYMVETVSDPVAV